MAHVLLGGDLHGLETVRTHLLRWGMTVGSWSVEDGWPSLQECDALIVVAPSAAGSRPQQDVSSRRPAAAPPAPLLLLGEFPGSLLLTREAQRVVSKAGPEGAQLRAALDSCLRENESRRQASSAPVGEDVTQGYLHFLGHELRSPLTAVKTALEVLQGELGGLDAAEQEDGDSRLKMLDIALRNIQRLNRTVDWSQDLLELERSLPPGRWETVPLTEVLAYVQDADRATCPDELRDKALYTDPNLLRVLVGQALRVLDYALPGVPLHGRLQVAQDPASGPQLWLVPDSATADLEAPRVARTGLTGAVRNGGHGLGEELRRLSEYVMSRPLLERLEIRVQIAADESGRIGLALQLPAALASLPPVVDRPSLTSAG